MSPSAAKAAGMPFSGFALAMAANLIWGTTFLASKYTLEVWSPVTASVLRFAVAIMAMFILLPLGGFRLRLPDMRWKSIRNILLVGFTGFGALYPLQLQGLKMISSGLSAGIMLTAPLFVLVFNALFFKEGISSRKLLALGIGILGGVLLLFHKGSAGENQEWLSGSLFTFGAAISLALSVIFTRKAPTTFDPANLTFWSMLAGFIMLVPFAVIESMNHEMLPASFSAIAALGYLGVICSAICFLIWNQAIFKSSPAELATTMHVKTPAAVLLGTIIAGEIMSLPMIVGTIVVAVGVWVSQSTPKKKEV